MSLLKDARVKGYLFEQGNYISREMPAGEADPKS
jgi:hypothetical protein